MDHETFRSNRFALRLQLQDIDTHIRELTDEDESRVVWEEARRGLQEDLDHLLSVHIAENPTSDSEDNFSDLSTGDDEDLNTANKTEAVNNQANREQGVEAHRQGSVENDGVGDVQPDQEGAPSSAVKHDELEDAASSPTKKIEVRDDSMVKIPELTCIACIESKPSAETLTLDCKPEPHTYCHACLAEIFKANVMDPTCYPPKCCGIPISLDTCRSIFSEELVAELELKIEEIHTPDPTFCAKVDCGKFLRMNNIDTKGNIGLCAVCNVRTCTICKREAHSQLCPNDPEVKQLLDTAKEKKWQQCQRCKTMVELELGCHHITCTCSYQFCYLCGTRWKDCTCPLFDVVDSDDSDDADDSDNEDEIRNARGIDPEILFLNIFRPALIEERQVAVNQQAVDNAAEEEEEEGEDETGDSDAAQEVHHHNGWIITRRPGACELCGANYLPWLMRCRTCNAFRCMRCRNR